MAIEVVIVAAVAAVVAYLIATRPQLADGILFTRKLVFGGLSLIIALILIGTGSPMLVFIGFVALVVAWLWFFHERPDKAIR